MRAENPGINVLPWIYRGTSHIVLLGFLFWRGEDQETEAAPSIANLTVGQSFLFPFTPDGNQNYRVKLMFNSSVVVAAWIFQPSRSINKTSEGRVKILENHIKLDKLQMSDSGFYDLMIYYETGRSVHSRFHLQVFERLSKPSIIAECLGSNVILTCHSSQGSSVEYIWETLPCCKTNCSVCFSPVVQMATSEIPGSLNLTCTVQNNISRETSDPLDLKLCSTQPRGLGWTVVLCVILTGLLIGALIYLHRRSRRTQNTDQSEPIRDGSLLPSPTVEL